MPKLLVVGGVAAGATAAARARRLSGDAEITILEAGPDVSFANCGLPYYIGGDIESRSKLILQSPESFRDLYGVVVETETEALSIDRDAKTVTALHKPTNQQRVFEFDKLILAQGGKPVVPPLPGVERDHVFSLWTLGDMDLIHDFIEYRAPKKAVVVGGGFIGLEMVEALRKRGLELDIVEMMPHVMPQLEPEIAGFLQEELQSYGVGIYTSRAVTRIDETAVVLDDGTSLAAEMVLLSVGVRPTLSLAQAAGLDVGESGGLLVDEYLRTSDENIYGAGDMVEIAHRIDGRKVRIPLAGPANRQGRLAAGNALGHPRSYSGSLGTSIVRVFEAVAGSTGLSLAQARKAGLAADAVVVHKEHHTTYYPGSTPVTVMIIYDRETGIVLGAQTAGYGGADRRLDVLAVAASGKMTIHALAETDLAYSPPLGTANDPVNMAAFVAENRMTGYGPSLTAGELDEFAGRGRPFVIDVRDPFAFDRGHVSQAAHIPLTHIRQRLGEIPHDSPIIVYDETGKTGHQAVRQLMLAGFSNVVNASGGFTSLERHSRAVGFANLGVRVAQAEAKSVASSTHSAATSAEAAPGNDAAPSAVDPFSGDGPVVIDVRTASEYAMGAVPGAVNIPLDELSARIDEIGSRDRDIVVYCASGARSGYARRMLRKLGFTHVENGGGLMDMMVNRG